MTFTTSDFQKFFQKFISEVFKNYLDCDEVFKIVDKFVENVSIVFSALPHDGSFTDFIPGILTWF